MLSISGPIMKPQNRKREQQWWLSRYVLPIIFAVTLFTVNSYYWMMRLTSDEESAYHQKSSLLTSSAQSSSSPDEESSSSRQLQLASALLNRDTIRSSLLAEAPWAESHGADHLHYLGAGMLYYSFAYAFQAHTIVVLGSGGGFVPRLLKQAQRDLELSGATSTDNKPLDLILVDAHFPEAGYGSTFYAENEDTIMRQHFRDIRYVFQKTDDAFVMLQKEGIQIDYLHVDADHSYEQSWKDFANFFQLLSPRGVVSFHDTCHDEKRKCRTGVPQTIAKLRDSLDEFDLQLVDAHYLYRGIAFAIRRDAPALEAPKNRRMNFCKNNAKRLTKTSPGFTLNKRVGHLQTLGDFYECETRFNMTLLGAPCPFGSRRDSKGGCDECIPGMRGDDCTEFKYADQRSKLKKMESSEYLATNDMQQRQQLAAAWLARQNAQHIFEFGVSGEPTSNHLLHSVISVVAVDVLIEPTWTDSDEIPSIRLLPVKPEDVIGGNQYSSLDTLDNIDALICLDCDEGFSNPPAFAVMIRKKFPHVVTLVLEGSIDQAPAIDKVSTELGSAWQVETDITLGSQRVQQQYPGSKPRRMVLLTRKL